MHVSINLSNGILGLEDTVLKGLTKGSHLIAHLSEEDKDLVIAAKDERFPKAIAKSKDAESSAVAD